MLLACGIDIVSVKRIERILNKYGNRFLKKVFPEGIDYCRKKRRGEFAGCVAARFALKESVIKALSQLEKSVSFRDIAVSSGGMNLNVRVKGVEGLKLIYSISHERAFAVAVVNVVKVE